jgi:hypothetical protein
MFRRAAHPAPGAALLLILVTSAAAEPLPAIRPFAVSARPPSGCLFFMPEEAGKRGGRRPVLAASGAGVPATATMNLRGRVETFHASGLPLNARPAAVGAAWTISYVAADRALAVRLDSRVSSLGGEPGFTGRRRR